MSNLMLGNFPGVPEKRPYDALRNLQAKGFNDCKREYDSLNLTLDETEIMWSMKEALANRSYADTLSFTYNLNYTDLINMAQSIVSNASKIIKVTEMQCPKRDGKDET